MRMLALKDAWNWISLNLTEVALVVATLVLAWFTWGLRDATNRASKEAVWRSKEEHFQRVMADARNSPGGVLEHHTHWELITIAEEWGPGRHRNEVVQFMRGIAVRERELRKQNGGQNMLGVRSVLETWDRHGIDFNRRRTGEGVDDGRSRKLARISHQGVE